MGGNSPSHLPDESKGRGVTLVKGIRLSDNVINRMKLSSKGSTPPVPSDSQTPEPTPPSSPVESLPPPVPQTASQPPIARLVPPPVKFHSLPPSSPVEPAEAQTCPFVSSARSETPAVPEPPVPVVEAVTPTHSKLETQTPAPALEQTADLLSRSPVEVPALSEPSSQTPAVTIRPAATAEPLESAAPSASLSPSLDSALLPSAPSDAPCAAPPAVVTEVPSVLEPPAEPASHLPAPLEETSSPCHDEPSAVPTEESASPPLSDPSLPTGESTMSTDVPPQDEEEEPFSPVSPPTAALPISPEVVEEELRQKIRAEMENDLQQELNQRRLELERQLEEARARAEAEARATCRAQVEEQVKKTLEEEKAAYVEKLTESIAKERVKSEDEKLMAQLYWMELKARQLDEKEKQLKKRDELRKEQVTKLEAKCAQFYKVSAESFQKGKEETERRFLHFNIQPVCGDLQSQILKCYKENTGKTLMCSSIASAYMQCVNKAKKDKLIPGG
ncbi:MICOS complex subunit Mic19 [Oryzias melastigma]|uniref:MICOS complex subunit Mic19 n=1 Tax=Oryzias melastigma TaxID=30732 RepID=A0A834BPQ0_ORYME|nr:MICOS complex subunit Mic19 [Oryzias melastigma]